MLDDHVYLGISEWTVVLAPDGHRSIVKRDKPIINAVCPDCSMSADDLGIEIRTQSDISRFIVEHQTYHDDFLEEQKYREIIRQKRRNRTNAD